MFIRLLVIMTLALTPVAALADDATQPTDAPAATDTPAPDAQGPASSGFMLGPSSLGSSPSSGGSTGDSVSLQPAGQNPLQSTTSDSTGLTAPNSSPLQAPANSDQALRVLSGEADGAPVQVAGNGPTFWGWLGMSLIFGLVVTAIYLLYRRYPRLLSPLSRVRIPSVMSRLSPPMHSPSRKKKGRRK